jgi:ArsR family transcriptional regulator
MISRKIEICASPHVVRSKMQLPKTISQSLERVGGLEQIRRSLPSRSVVKRVSGIFQSLSDPSRLSILYELSVSPLCVCVLKSVLKIADSKLSYHLDDLRSAGLVSSQSEGRFMVYRITDLGRDLLRACSRLGRTDAKLEEGVKRRLVAVQL